MSDFTDSNRQIGPTYPAKPSRPAHIGHKPRKSGGKQQKKGNPRRRTPDDGLPHIDDYA
jgi:hypothetical protein